MNTAKASPRLRGPRDDALAADAARVEHELGALLELSTELAAEAVRASALTSQAPDRGVPRYSIAGRRAPDPPPQS